MAFLVEAWGVAKFQAELKRRMGAALLSAGKDKQGTKTTDHIGVTPQKQAGLNAIGLVVPVGRVTAEQLEEVARLAETYGTGDVRFTTAQNIIIPNIPDARLASFSAEPLLASLPMNPPGVVRGLVSCTGIDYCHFALIETKDLAVVTARELATRVPAGKMLTMHWSGCPAGCGNHLAADIGLLGKNARIDGQIVDAVDVFIGGKSGPGAKAGTKILEDVPCDVLPDVLERVIPYIGKRAPSASSATSSSRPVAAPAPVRATADL
jgi:ferredoxin-nitrite reductase